MPTIEQVRAYWDARPCNIRHGTAAVGTRDYFDQVEARKYFVEPHIPGFARFDDWAGRSVLEIGCGIGTDAVNFARAGARYTGIDLSAESVALCHQRFDLFGLPGRILVADVEHLDQVLPPERFDLVYAFGVLHHTPRPAAAIETLRSYLDADSEFRLMLYAHDSLKRREIDAQRDQPEAQDDCPVAYTYTHDEVRALLAGFEVTELRQDHIFPFVVEQYVRHEYVRQPWIEEMDPAAFRALEEERGWHTLITSRLSR